MTYEEAIDYIGSISSFGIKLGMERIVSLLSHLDDPQKFLKVIHVAGTNGKGSFGTFLSEILMASGYKVGRYISPALYDYRERIQINGQYISKEAVSGYIEKIRKICLQMTAGGEEHPTVFEVETAMALMYFWDMDCDYVVLEVGMGGRLDSTNVIDEPLLSVITSISKDHTQALGDTLEAIAGEKAGIIKEGCPVLAYDQDESVIKVLRTQAQQRHAPLILTDWTALCVSGTSIQGQTFDYQALHGLTIHMAGIYQVYNAAAAVQAALQEGSVAAEPVITVSPKQGNYSNDEKVTVEIACATDGAEIYYVVENSNDLTNGKLSDFEKHKVLYEKPLTLTMENPKGGTLYIRAAAKVGEKNWSPTARKDLTFVKAVGKEAFEVNGSKYGTWKEAVSALEEAGSGEIILGDDVELQEKDTFPSVSCTIRSGNERKCKIKGGVMEARADITFENVVYDVNRIYGNGHSVTIGADVETPFSFTRRAIFAGTAHDAEEKEITANPVLSVESGKFALYGSGSSGTTLKGNVEIKVKGTADVEIAGAYMNSTVNGKVTVSVEDEAVLSEFLGELSKGSVQALELVMTGSPKLDGRTFRGTVNGEPKGTLDLRQASLSPEQVEKFKDFAEVLKADSPAAEETLTKPDEETVTVEKEKEEAAEEAAVIAKMIAEAVSDFSDPGESDLL